MMSRTARPDRRLVERVKVEHVFAGATCQYVAAEAAGEPIVASTAA